MAAATSFMMPWVKGDGSLRHSGAKSVIDRLTDQVVSRSAMRASRDTRAASR